MDKLKALESKILKYKQKHSSLKSKRSYSLEGGVFVVAELVAGIGIGGWLGYYLDQYFNTKVLFLLILITIGLMSAFYNIYNKYK